MIHFVWIQIICVLSCNLYFTEAALPKIGPVGKIEILSLTECNEKPDNELAKTFIVETDLKDVDGEKYLSGKITLPMAFDDSFKFKAKLEYNDGDKYITILPFEGVVTHAVKRFIPKLWAKIAKAANVSPVFPVAAGTYEIKDYKIDMKDAMVPAIFYGKLRIEVAVLKDTDPIFCRQLELNSLPPNE